MSQDPLLVFGVRTPGVCRRALHEFAATLRLEVAGGRPFCCRITSDGELRRLNLEFRGRDEPTDVLSFPALDQAGHLGDIAISAGRAREQAARFGHSVETEICILLLHGVLHLLGYDHETDRGRMRRAEQRWRLLLGLPHGLTGRPAAGRGGAP